MQKRQLLEPAAPPDSIAGHDVEIDGTEYILETSASFMTFRWTYTRGMSEHDKGEVRSRSCFMFGAYYDAFIHEHGYSLE